MPVGDCRLLSAVRSGETTMHTEGRRTNTGSPGVSASQSAPAGAGRATLSETAPWRVVTARYERPHLLCSLRQLADTLIPFFLLLTLMYRSLAISYGLTLVLAVPTALFYVRLFVLFHD